MKKLALVMILALSQFALADSPELTDKNSGEGIAFVYTGGFGSSSVRIRGEAARVLFESLEVKSVGNFSLVQTQTKTLQNVECVQAILGDVPGQMSEPAYTCTIIVSKK